MRVPPTETSSIPTNVGSSPASGWRATPDRTSMPNDQEIGPDGDFGPGASVAQIALAGLLAPRKTLPPSLFYDEEGCRLFYRITELPEYYLTRTEFRLLET